MLKRPPLLKALSVVRLRAGPCRRFGDAAGPEAVPPPKKPQTNQTEWLRSQFRSVRLHLIDFHYQHKLLSYALMVGAAVGVCLYFFGDYFYMAAPFSEFLKALNKGEVDFVAVDKVYAGTQLKSTRVRYKSGSAYYKSEVVDYESLVDELAKAIHRFPAMVVRAESKSKLERNIETFGGVMGVFMFMTITAQAIRRVSMKGQRPSIFSDQMTKNKAKKFTKETNLGVKFEDVAGMRQAKLEITEFVDFLKHPQRFFDIGARLPKGALLAGPPGTGKTLLGKACAGEAEVPFYYVSGSEFVELFVGLGASRVRDLFEEAKKNAPCIIFIDEIDAIGKKRSERLGGSSESDSTLNQILVEMDGFGTNSRVIVFAATNRKELLDDALTRPGRLDRSIDVPLPDLEGRRDIFMVHLKKIKLEEGAIERHANRLAALTPGFSGAEIANICNEAAIQAVRGGKDVVQEKDFEVAVERVIGGIEKKRSDNNDDRKTVAVHESGHGTISWFLEGALPLLKLTIVPRSKGALGFAQYLPNEVSLETQSQMEDKIVAVLAGRCAEEEFFGRVTTGAYDDLQKATRIARAIVLQLGMTDKLANIAHQEDDYGNRIFSDKTAQEIDEEVRAILARCTERCRALIRQHKNKIQALSDELLAKETLELRDITRILGERPFPPPENFKAYLAHS